MYLCGTLNPIIMSNKTYNGWSNYETWRIALEFFDSFEAEEGQFKDISELADYMKDLVEQAIDENGQNIATDYAHAFVSAVNFYEIAEHSFKMQEV